LAVRFVFKELQEDLSTKQKSVEVNTETMTFGTSDKADVN